MLPLDRSSELRGRCTRLLRITSRTFIVVVPADPVKTQCPIERLMMFTMPLGERYE
jgi:hypothetical protein